MNQELFEECFGEVIPTIDRLPMPIALVDSSFTLIWANPYLQKNHPYFNVPDSVIILMGGYDLDQVCASLQDADTSKSYPSKLPMLSTVLDFSPVFSSDRAFAGAIVHFSIFNLDPVGLNENDANKLMAGFSNAIRSPLASIFSTVSAMAGRLRLDDTDACELLLSSLNKNCYQLLKGFTSVMEYSSYCNGLSVLKPQCVRLNTFLDDLLMSARMMLRGSGVSLTYELPDENSLITFDPDKIAIALMALISNSATFIDEDSENGNEIFISVSLSDRYVTFNISDYGVGIPEEIQPRIFEPYFSYGKDSYLYASVGLGLPLSKMIITQHGGTIAVNSIEGEGTTVAFTIPRNTELVYDEMDEMFDDIFSDDTASYLRNKFSSLYVFLSDVCECPEP